MPRGGGAADAIPVRDRRGVRRRACHRCERARDEERRRRPSGYLFSSLSEVKRENPLIISETQARTGSDEQKSWSSSKLKDLERI